MKSRPAYLFFFVLFFSLQANAQFPQGRTDRNLYAFSSNLLKVSTRSYGMILGVQRGKFTFFEFGAEMHWNKVKLVNPRTFSLGANFEYNFGNNVLGYKVSGWAKVGRINLTYGLNLCYYTDFDSTRLGLGPAIGFRLLGFHLINGINLTIGDKYFQDYNKIYVTIRYFFPLDRKIKFKKTHKGKKDKND